MTIKSLRKRLWQKNAPVGKEDTIDTSTISLIRPIEFPLVLAHNYAPMNANAANTTLCSVAIIMDCTTLANNRWQTEQWEASSVIRDTQSKDIAERVIVRDEKLTRIKFHGHEIRLFRDEAEGYLYNITSPYPKVFVLWRMHDEVARPERVTVSYHEGARWMDSDEKVDGVPLPAELVPWIREFAELHYKPEPKKPKRYASNKDKGRMGRID